MSGGMGGGEGDAIVSDEEEAEISGNSRPRGLVEESGFSWVLLFSLPDF